jgi:hypothetical protein
MFTNVSFAFREAVDITTYDQNVSNSLRALAAINADIRGEEMMDKWYKDNPDPFAANGLLKQVQSDPIVAETEQSAKALGYVNLPAEGTPIADQGRVINYTPPPQLPGNSIA